MNRQGLTQEQIHKRRAEIKESLRRLLEDCLVKEQKEHAIPRLVGYVEQSLDGAGQLARIEEMTLWQEAIRQVAAFYPEEVDTGKAGPFARHLCASIKNAASAIRRKRGASE